MPEHVLRMKPNSACSNLIRSWEKISHGQVNKLNGAMGYYCCSIKYGRLIAVWYSGVRPIARVVKIGLLGHTFKLSPEDGKSQVPARGEQE